MATHLAGLRAAARRLLRRLDELIAGSEAPPVDKAPESAGSLTPDCNESHELPVPVVHLEPGMRFTPLYPSLSVGTRVVFRRLGDRGYSESTVRAIFPTGLTVELATGEIVPAGCLIPVPDDFHLYGQGVAA